MAVILITGGARSGKSKRAEARARSFAGRPIYIEDIVATIYSAMGVDWTKSIENTPFGRRYIYVTGAETGQFGPVDEVFI